MEALYRQAHINWYAFILNNYYYCNELLWGKIGSFGRSLDNNQCLVDVDNGSIRSMPIWRIDKKQFLLLTDFNCRAPYEARLYPKAADDMITDGLRAQ